jgi:hypothetical protein
MTTEFLQPRLGHIGLESACLLRAARRQVAWIEIEQHSLAFEICQSYRPAIRILQIDRRRLVSN